MSDMNKAEKLAAARKKLKEFQQKSKENPTVSKTSTGGHEEITKETNDKNTRRDFVFDSGPHRSEDSGIASTTLNEQLGHPLYPTVELFSTTGAYSNSNIDHQQQSMPSSYLSSASDVLVPTSTQDFFDSFPDQRQEWLQSPQSFSASYDIINNSPQGTEGDVRCATDHISALRSAPAECTTTWAVALPLSADSVAEPPPPMDNMMPGDPSQLGTGSNGNQPMSGVDLYHVPYASEDAPISARSTSESIRQLSQEMNGLIAEAVQTSVAGETSDLECRNQELAALLEIERQSTEQLRLQIKEYQSHVSKLSSQLETVRTDEESRVSNELTSVQDQLKLHVQTIGILVAEKTELQSSLLHCQAEAKLKVSEAEDLQGRLKARRYRVSELEKELTALRVSLEASELSHQVATKELNQLRIDQAAALAKEQQSEEEYAELNHRLTSKTDECIALGNELHDTRTRLSLAQLRLTQLGSEDSAATTMQMHQAKIALEQRVAELESALKKSDTEHERSNQQFQQYVRGVESQLSELTEKVDELEAQKKTLVEREQSLIGHVADLEKRIQEQNTTEQSRVPDKTLQVRLSQLEEEKQALSKELSDARNHLQQFEETVQVRESRMEELEAMVDHLQGDQPDQSRLLAAMESDKVAAARAVSQNQCLKVQLQELQDGFVKLSDCKLDLTDKLEHERYRCQQLEEQITHLRTHLEHHDYDHDHDSSESCQLDAAKKHVDDLSKENDELRKLVAQLTASYDQSPEDSESTRDDSRALLSASVKLLEGDKVQLRSEPSVVTQEAMDRLQEQFTKKMAEIADLSDEKQRLEHLVLQLQGETETIGEYIALYQKQRCLLRQRAEEKETQLKCLAQDREEMRVKLTQLNNLIGRLVAEKASVDEDDAESEHQSEITNGELMEIKKQVSEKFPIPEKTSSEVTSEEKEKGDTAGKILALLSEIGTSNLVDPHHPVEHFHPCAWCSGRLITV